MPFSIRRAAPADRPEVEALLAEIFVGEDVRARYEWLHKNNPHGRSIVWFAVDESGEIAGCASYFPRRIVAEGKIVGAALGGDCWVRPKFRRRGIATALHAEGRKDMVSDGIEVMFGTPTPANETPLNQIGARNIGFVVRYARPLEVKRVPFSGLLLRRGWGHARLDPIAGVDRRVDEIWERTASEITLGTVRDAAFYDWRFSQSPSKKQAAFVIVDGGAPIAACALERYKESLRIVDLVAPRNRWGAALGAIVDAARTYAPNATVISLRLVVEDGVSRAPVRWGFFAREQKVFNVLLPDGDPRRALYDDIARWHISYADTDLDRG